MIPKKFGGYDDKRFEIRRSLRTNLRSLAVERSRRLLVGVEALMTQFEMKGIEEHPIEWLKRTIDELIKQDEIERERRQQFFDNLLAEAISKLEPPYEVIDTSPKKKKSKKPSKPRLNGLAGTRLSEAIESYCKELRPNWREKTEFENRYLLNLIVEVLGDRQIGSLTLEDMRQYKVAVLSLPKNRTKIPIYRNKSVQELLEMEIPSEERLSSRNTLKYLSRAKTFLKWARLNGFISSDVGSVLTYKLPEREKKTRKPFNHKDLRKLIKSPEYLENKHRHSHHFWLPLLGMFTGARLNELCQLHCSDIVRRYNYWVIQIKDDHGNKRVKNRTSVRDIPIHSKLIEFGFLKFVKHQKKKGEERLFSELKAHRDGYGGSASKWFCDYQKRCGVKIEDPKRELKSFHSYRHTVATVLAAKTNPLLHERVINQLLGHEKGKSESMRTYAHTIHVKTLGEAVEHIKYHIDFKHLLDPKINKYLKL